MKRLMSGVAALAMMAAIAPATQADVNVGDKMPEMKVGQLYNNEHNIDVSDLKGHIVVVEFWATWCGPCRAQIPHLNELNKKFKEKGVLILSISDESESLVAPFVKQQNMQYLVASDSKMDEVFGVRAIPHAVLFNPEGIAEWKGHPAELDAQLEKAVGKYPNARPLGSGPDYNEKLFASIEASLLKGDNPGAISLLRRVDRKSLDAREGHRARYDGIVNRITPMAEADFNRAMSNVKNKQYADALATLSRVASEYRGLPIADKAAAELKRLDGDPEVLKAKRSDAIERQADNMLRRAKAQAEDGDKVMAYLRLKNIVEKYPGTAAATEAQTILTAYEADAELMKKVNDR